MKIDIAKFTVAGTTPTAKAKDTSNPHRVTVGQVFIQPTGGKGKPFNFTYGYYGMLDKTGKFVTGFSMSNIKMLEAVSEGLLPKAFLTAFEAYAAKCVEAGENAIKVEAA